MTRGERLAHATLLPLTASSKPSSCGGPGKQNSRWLYRNQEKQGGIKHTSAGFFFPGRSDRWCQWTTKPSHLFLFLLNYSTLLYCSPERPFLSQMSLQMWSRHLQECRCGAVPYFINFDHRKHTAEQKRTVESDWSEMGQSTFISQSKNNHKEDSIEVQGSSKHFGMQCTEMRTLCVCVRSSILHIHITLYSKVYIFYLHVNTHIIRNS